MYLSKELTRAIHTAQAENNVAPSRNKLLIFLAETLDALYSEVLRFPYFWAPHPVTSALIEDSSGNLILQLPRSPTTVALLRSALHLAGDIFVLLRTLLDNIGELGIARAPLELMRAEAAKFRDIRNHFAHVDSRLVDSKSEHGIDGSHSLTCGLEYINTKNSYHLVVSGNTIYFSDYHQCKETDISSESFFSLLKSAKSLYDTFVAAQPADFHSTHRSFSEFYVHPIRKNGIPSRIEVPGTRRLWRHRW